MEEIIGSRSWGISIHFAHAC